MPSFPFSSKTIFSRLFSAKKINHVYQGFRHAFGKYPLVSEIYGNVVESDWMTSVFSYTKKENDKK